MLEQQLIQRTHRVPAPVGPAGDGTRVARQLDAALLSVGFKASRDLLEHLGALHPDTIVAAAAGVIGAVRDLVGDKARHNTYFRAFPKEVPDTFEFWAGLLSRALVEAGVSRDATIPGIMLGGINLLDLPGYGSYQHTYEEMLAAHEQFIPALTDRVTILHLGGSLNDEAGAVYADLATSRTPLSEDERVLLEILAAWCEDGVQPEAIPVRENKALINRVRLAHGKPLLIDTVTDVLRLAAAVSGGDVTLETATRFTSFPRHDRRALLAALDTVAANPGKLADIPAWREEFKRLGERLHPHEYADRYPHATSVFAVARGEALANSLAGRIDAAFETGNPLAALALMAKAPGVLVRGVDRAARSLPAADLAMLREAVADAVAHASGRVLLSLREHLVNRTAEPDAQAKRIFVGRTARAWVADDTRPPLDTVLVTELTDIIDAEISARMPETHHLVIDPAVYTAAVPLSGKTAAPGFGIMPRGSRTPVTGTHLRFFIHWMQSERTTDYDLSVLMLDENFQHAGQVSWTRLSESGAVHSGDLTQAPAPNGASEFIDLDLTGVKAAYVVPQVNIYSGESFTEAAESYFGYMTLNEEQRGKPFEPRTVRIKAEMRGSGRVALPLAFVRAKGGWEAVWMNLFATGAGWGNRIEGNRLSTALLARTMLQRRYLPLAYLVDAYAAKAGEVTEWKTGRAFDEPVTFIGLERPENLPDGSDVYALDRWNLLVPE